LTGGGGQKAHVHPPLTPDRKWILLTDGDPRRNPNPATRNPCPVTRFTLEVLRTMKHRLELALLLAVAFFCLGPLAATLAAGAEQAPSAAAKKKIVFLPGRQSHGWSAHAYPAECKLLADILNKNVPGAQAVVVEGGWPKDLSVLDGVAAIVIACDGNGVLGPEDNYKALDAIAKAGVGIAYIHYALDPGTQWGKYLLDWLGGYYEQHWSVNPSWKAEFKQLPDHPITRGVRPFAIHDEWYYHMRFRENMQGVTPILSAVPPERTRQGRDGPHSGNPTVRSRVGMAEHVGWAYERPDGGRGFGFTGGHDHWNYAHDGFRQILLNAICWVAKIDVPPQGVPSPRPTAAEMEANLGGNRPADWTSEQTQKIIDEFNQ